MHRCNDFIVPGISRREFLKLLAAGGIVAVGGAAGLGTLSSKNSKQAMAQSSGTWSDGPKTQSHAVHLALLHTGKVLYVAGSGYHNKSADGPYKAGVWDPATNSQTEYDMDEDLFCAGQAVLPNGNVLFVGGTLQYPFQTKNHLWWGLNVAYEFDVQSETFLARPSMAHGRWYPTAVVLDSGKVQVLEGYDEYGYHNLLTEIYDPDTASWTISYDPNTSRTYCVGCSASRCANIPGAGSPCYGGPNKGVNPVAGLYPRMHLMPSGLVAVVGQKIARRFWNPATGRWYGTGSGTQRSYGTSVILPLQNIAEEKGRILVCGGSEKTSYPALATNSAEILEPSGFKINSRFIKSMKYQRRYCNPVLLPTGQVIIFGGTRENNDLSLAVYNPEMFDPVTEGWSELPPHSVPRFYHSGAILLLDGRVWTAGCSYSASKFDLRTEIFSPSYISEPRPVISGAPTGGSYGGTISIPTPDASGISAVSLVRISSTTHHYNTDQRLIWLQIRSKGPDKVTVSAPINSRLAPPGYYMIHVLDGNGVPSAGSVIKI
jgi:hypothetical protein